MSNILVILAEGFEETEAVTIIDVLRRGNITVTAAGLTSSLITGAHGITIQADTTLMALTDQLFNGVILPGGMGGTKNMLNSTELIALLQRHAAAGKVTAAICAAPWVLEKANLLEGKKATIYPGLEDKLISTSATTPAEVIKDDKIITSKGPGTAMSFALALVAEFADDDTANQVAKGLLFTG